MKKWTKIADNKIRMVWMCPECQVETIVAPTFYQEAGTPICTSLDLSCEGSDMEYIRTEISK